MPLRFVLLVALLARPVAAQAPDTTARAAGATVSGVVRDSLAHAPLAGAVVQLVAVDDPASGARSAASDSIGRYALGAVPTGRYTLGFLHPLLDSLGVEAPLREVVVDGARPVRADLATPSPARFRAAICGAPPADDAGAVVVGVVRDARDGVPAAGARVAAEWLELSFTKEGLRRRAPQLVATTGENGWFALCNVPRAGTIALVASRGADSTDLLEVQVPTEGFLRRELYLGPTQADAVGDTTRHVDTLATPTRRVKVGDGRLSGMVIAAVGGQPLAGAQVRVIDGPQTRANERGEWTLAGAPLGTRMLEVRAVGYYPERRAVDVVAGAPSVRVALSTLKAVLDTVRITATRIERSGFAERRRRGAGRFLGPDDVAQRRPIVTSDLFDNVPGVRLERATNGVDEAFVMRGPFGSCTPAIYVDGRYFDGLGAADIDAWMRPHEIAGIEIYSEASVPAQFRRLAASANADDAPCGSIVIWTK